MHDVVLINSNLKSADVFIERIINFVDFINKDVINICYI